MYIIRDIFQLKFGHFKDARGLLDQAVKNGIMPQTESVRLLSDFTGHSYRLIFEEQYKSLADYEHSLTSGMAGEEWQKWYEQFKQHVDSSYREILKLLS
jgi:hypothetical protein